MNDNISIEDFSVVYLKKPPVHIIDDVEWTDNEKEDTKFHFHWPDMGQFWKKNLILILVIIFLPLWTIGAVLVTATVVKKNTTEEMTHYWRGQIQVMLDQQEQQRMADGLLTGKASLEEAITSAVNAVAPVIAKLNTDKQKLTEASCMLARVLSPAYPNSFEEVASQPSQWMFYDGSDKTCTQHDKELAEQIIRPYMEQGIIPLDLTADLVYGSWSQNDFKLRDNFTESKAGEIWRYHG